MPQKRSPAAQVLAGKRATRPVMRNGVEANRPRGRQGTADGPLITTLDECSTAGAPGEAVVQQRLRALEKGNLVRTTRAKVRRDLAKGALDFDTFLDETPESCLEVPLGRLLTWLPNIRRDRARAIVGTLPDVTEDTRVCELAPRVKYLLSRRVGPFVDAYRRSVYAAA